MEKFCVDKSSADNKFTTVYSKEDTDNLLAQKLDSGVINNYFDKSTIENKLSSKADIETIYSKDETEERINDVMEGAHINFRMNTYYVSIASMTEERCYELVTKYL